MGAHTSQLDVNVPHHVRIKTLSKIGAHILQDRMHGINQTSIYLFIYLHRVTEHFTTMNINNCKRIPKSLWTR